MAEHLRVVDGYSEEPEQEETGKGSGSNLTDQTEAMSQGLTAVQHDLKALTDVINKIASGIDYQQQRDHIYPEKEWNMNNISREELDSKLGQNKANIEAVASGMRAEIAEFRTFQTQQFASLSASISDLKGDIYGLQGKITGDITAIKGELTGTKEGISGQIDGLKSSVATIQWMVGAVLAIIGIGAAILAIPGIDTFF